MTILSLEHITKTFTGGFWGRKNTVLSDVNLELRRGEVFGLLGHNGAGKTTTMRIVLGLLRPTAGRVTLFGECGASCRSRSRIGFLGDEIGLYPYFNAREMLQLTGELFRIPKGTLAERTNGLLELVGLEAYGHLKIKKYSKGMRQRLGIALAILNDPEFLILDEPYSGLDPIGRRQMRKLLLKLKSEGKTILLSSHIVPDVEAVCDRVGILAEGAIEKCLSLKEIYDHKSTPVEITIQGVEPSTFEGMDFVDLVYHNEEALVVKCRRRGLVKAVISKTYAYGGEVVEVKPLKFNLEDYLFEALGASASGADRIRPEVKEWKTYATSR